MGVNTTLLHGLETYIRGMLPKIAEMELYFEEDTNPLYELSCSLEEALDEIAYALREMKND